MLVPDPIGDVVPGFGALRPCNAIVRDVAVFRTIATLPPPITATLLPTALGVSYSGSRQAFIRGAGVGVLVV